MVRSQIILDDELAALTRACADRTGESVSSLVRKALRAYLVHDEPDTSWIGSLRPSKGGAHAMHAVRSDIERGWAEECRK